MLRQALLDAVTPEDIQAIVRQLIHKACEGDVAAARLVLAYAVGKPDRAVDPDTVEVHEFQLWQQSAIANQDLSSVLGRMQADLANEICRNAVPSVQETTAGNLGQALRDSLAKPSEPAAKVPHEVMETKAPANGMQQSADLIRSAAAPAPQAEPARDSRENRCETRGGQPEAEDSLAEEMYREFEQEFWLEYLREMARLVRDPGHPDRADGPPAPIANGFFSAPPPS